MRSAEGRWLPTSPPLKPNGSGDDRTDKSPSKHSPEHAPRAVVHDARPTAYVSPGSRGPDASGAHGAGRGGGAQRSLLTELARAGEEGGEGAAAMSELSLTAAAESETPRVLFKVPSFYTQVLDG
eukprot:2165695-Rhodomonas_salina.4